MLQQLLIMLLMKYYCPYFFPDTSQLKHAKLASGIKPIQVKVFDRSLGNFMAHSFEVVGKYMFVQVWKSLVC